MNLWFKSNFYKGQYVKDEVGNIYKIVNFGKSFAAYVLDVFNSDKDNYLKKLTNLTALTEEEKKTIAILFK